MTQSDVECLDRDFWDRESHPEDTRGGSRRKVIFGWKEIGKYRKDAMEKERGKDLVK